MPTTTLPQQETINQYTADGDTSIFTYAYYILLDEDIDVYVTLSGQTANPANDIKVLNVDYTVQGAGTLSGGTITFTTNPPISSIVTLVRNIKAELTTNFADVQNFNGANLDNALLRNMLVSQQNNTFDTERTLHYAVNSYLPDTVDQVDLPLLDEERSVWMKRNDAIASVVIAENEDVSTLRSELANEAQGTDGASIVGYYDINGASGKTVTAYLNNLSNFGEDVGSVNAYQINVPGFNEPPTKGNVVRFMPASTNTAEATFKINNSGVARDIYAGQAQVTTAGNIVSGYVTELVFDGANWVISTPSNSVINRTYYANDTSVVANTITLSIPKMSSTLVLGDRICFVCLTTNTGDSAIHINGGDPVYLLKGDPYTNIAVPLNANDLLKGQSYQATFENGYWNLQNPSNVYAVQKQFYGFKVYQDTNQGFAANVASKMLYQIASYNPQGLYDISTNSFTVVKSGYYRFTVNMWMLAEAGVGQSFTAYVVIVGGAYNVICGGNYETLLSLYPANGSDVLYLSAGQQIEVFYLSVLNAVSTVNADGYNYLTCEYVGSNFV